MNEYPKRVKAKEVVNGSFAPGLFMLIGGRAKYDQVWMCDGGNAIYLVRVNGDLSTVRRWIGWDTELMQMFKGDCDE